MIYSNFQYWDSTYGHRPGRSLHRTFTSTITKSRGIPDTVGYNVPLPNSTCNINISVIHTGDGWIEEAPDPLSEGVKLPLPSPYPRPRRPKDHTISQHIRRMGWALPWPQEMLRSPSPEPKVKVKPEVPGGAVPKTEADVKPVIPTVKTESQDQSG